ncbi:MAG: RES domain-containing protein [Sphingomonas sp.]|nr:RES domain-containing protein [Sphingomonas sp.]
MDGPVWRIVLEPLAATPFAPAAAPEGRFHHSGQIAVYASLTAAGAAVAIKRYLTDNRQRLLVPMWLTARDVADVRGDAAASVVWQDQRQSGLIASTWAISDSARLAGAQAMLYSSRSRPELAHVVVFDPACLSVAGPATPLVATGI